MQARNIQGVVVAFALMMPAALIARAADDGDDAAPPSVPAALQVGADQQLYFAVDADGVQIYDCRATATGFAWTFIAPEATLYDDGEVVGTHYAGPTWEGNNGGKVVGAVAARSPAPVAGAIPWLLLTAVSNAGHGPFSKVTSIQRLETGGGVAPASGCDAATIGARARVPYVARYYFYKAKPGGH